MGFKESKLAYPPSFIGIKTLKKDPYFTILIKKYPKNLVVLKK